MANNANNFAGLKLNNLRKSILTNSYVLKLFCKNFNTRVVQLETADGTLVAFGEGFSIIPNLKKLSEQKVEIGCKLPFSPKLADTKLDFQLLRGATVTIKKAEPSLLTAIVEDWNGDILFTGSSVSLSTLLFRLEKKVQKTMTTT